MYKYNLIISIFSNDKNLKKVISNIKPIDKFNHKIEIFDKINNNIISTSDIIIWDLDSKINFKKMVKKDTKIIICSNQYYDDFKAYDEIFIKPFDYKLVEYQFKKILEKIKLEEELHFTNACLNTAIDGIPDMFWIKSLDGIHTLLNKEFCNVVDKTKEDATGKDHYYIWNVSKDDPNSGADICKKTEDEVIKAGHTLNFLESVKSKKGTRQLITYKSPLYDKNGTVIGTVGVGHDITDLKNMSVENQILLNSVPYAVLIKDNKGYIQNINSNFEIHFDISKNKIIGMLYKDWVQKTFKPDIYTNNEGYTEGITYNIKGKEKIFELRFDNICDVFNNITGQICIFRDVTLERQLEKQIIESSNVDFMTGLYNRRYLDNFISEQSKDTNLSLLSIDLDHFKVVNDTYGHKMGDEALILTSNIIKNCFPNDLAVRMGGDEFIIVKIGNQNIKKIEKEAQKLLDSLNQNFKKNSSFGILSASIGIAQGNIKNNNIDTLLQQSDIALYEAKQTGRACYCVYQNNNRN